MTRTTQDLKVPQRRWGGGGSSRPSPAFLALVGVITVVTLVPLGYVVSIGLQVGWDTLAPLIFRPKVGELLVNTVLLVVIATPLCVVLGVGGAWLVERTAVPGRRVWAILLAAPLAIPAFVSGYAWVSAVPSIAGLGGGLLVSTLAYYPLVYLPAAAAIRGLDPALEESARSLGYDSWAVFLRVVLPQLRLAVWGGALIVALHLLAEYGAFALLRFDTFTTAIMVQFQSSFAGPAASALGAVLAALCLMLLVLESSSRGRARYARVGSGVPHAPAVFPLHGWTIPTLAGLGVLIALAVGVPVTSVLRWLSFGDPWSQPQLGAALAQTAFLAGGGAILTVLMALPIAWLSVRHPSRLNKTIEGATYVASSLPAIVIALALVTVAIRIVPMLYQTAFTVLLAYALIFLPRALVSVRAGIAQAPIELEEAARALGRSPFHARLRITLPLLLPSIAAGTALVALGAANELTATLLLAPNGTRTLATGFWSATSALQYSDAAPYAALLIMLSVPAVAIMFVQSRKATRG
jgi:iron(III) transport system permease protein